MIKKITKKHIIIIIVFSIIALIIRISQLNNLSYDMYHFLLSWMKDIIDHGKIYSLKYTIGDYNVPYIFCLTIISYFPISTVIQYVYAIKGLSIIFDYILAISMMILVYKLTLSINKSTIAYVITLLLPTVIANSSWWGQCDSIYTSFVIIALIFLIDKKYLKSLFILGIAFSFKLQTIFILPLWCFLWATGDKSEFKIFDFLIFFLPIIILGLPAIIMGRSVINTYNIYLLQSHENSNILAAYFYNYYMLLFKNTNGMVYATNNIFFDYSGIFILFAILLSLFIYLLKHHMVLEKKEIIFLALWTIFTTTFFLPHMDDRYAFMANVISIAYAMIYIKRWYIPALIQLTSFVGYIYELKTILMYPMSLINLIILIYITDILINEILNKKNIINNDKKELT